MKSLGKKMWETRGGCVARFRVLAERFRLSLDCPPKVFVESKLKGRLG